MTDITLRELEIHLKHSEEMGNRNYVNILTDFIDYYKRKETLSERQANYARSIFYSTGEEALRGFRDYKVKLNSDEEYRERLRVIARYYEQTSYNKETASAVLGYLNCHPSAKPSPPPYEKVMRMLDNDYAKNVWASHKAEPKFQTGDLVRLRANAYVGHRLSRIDSWMVIAIGAKPIDTSHVYNEKTGGTKRYDLLEVGGTTVITVMEKHLKKHRVPKNKKRT